MMKRQKLLLFLLFFLPAFAMAQLPDAMKLPDFVSPTPEVSALLKADNLATNSATGAPTINIPIGSIAVGGVTVPVALSYTSTGVKINEYSSNVGTGWTCTSGGVVSRSILGKADEVRDGSPYPSNHSSVNFGAHDANLLYFLQNHVDAQSDVFSFSFPGGSGKFILDSTLTTILPLSNYNYKITVINGNFLNGFKIITDNGTTYLFEDAETSLTRNPTGSNCPKNLSYDDHITSWYLTKIIAPNKRSYINFTYSTWDITFEQSITQYISRGTYTQQHYGGGGTCPSGDVYPVGTEVHYTCVPRQTVTSKFISSITSSARDTIKFIYDNQDREDLEDGKRLEQIKVVNQNGKLIKQVSLRASYESGVLNSSYTNANKRMFLNGVDIEDVNDAGNTLSYDFDYISKGSIANRLTFAQDIYGYYNGKTSNPSLIPILPSTDINYLVFDSGRAATSVDFGDRSIDTVYGVRGLLNKITYPTGGYDTIIYQPNKYYNGTSDILVGGFSVKSIQSYSFGQKAMERSFSYTDTSGHYSTFVLNTVNNHSSRSTINTDGFTCNNGPGHFPNIYCEGPSYEIGQVSSDIVSPVTVMGGQSVYHRVVKEKLVGSEDNGYTERYFQFYNGGNLLPQDLMGNKILSAPFQIPAEFELGETETKIFRYDTITSGYKLQQHTKKYQKLYYTATYKNYIINKNFWAIVNSSPPSVCEFNPWDVTCYFLNKYTILTDSVIQKSWDNNNDSFLVKTLFEYGNSAHTYPTKQIVHNPDGNVLETRYEYPLDGSASVMTSRNIVSPVLVQKNYKNSTLLSTITNTYNNWFGDSTVVAIEKTEYKELTNSMPAHINYIHYDTLGNVLELAKDSSEHITYIWGYKKQIPIAKITNAAVNEVFCTSFEEIDGTSDAGAKTGGKSHSGNYSVTFTLPNAKNYRLSYWEWNGSKWEYHEVPYTGSTTITTSYKIDELRIFPEDGQVITYTHEPLQGITSICDVRNMVAYYEYDALNRLKLIRDEEGKILKLYDYKYRQ